MEHHSDRVDLAAVFRWSARLGMHESVANHFSLAINDDATQFLINPNGRHFANMCASDLLLVDAHDRSNDQESAKLDPTAWAIHSAIHRNISHARCVLHLHPHYATALASLADSRLPPIDLNTMRFFDRVAIDESFGGMGLGDEAERLSRVIDDKPIVVLGNHGVMAIGESAAIAFGHLYYFEKACRNYLTALATGRPLRVVADDIAEKTALEWQQFVQPLAENHLTEIHEILGREQPEYLR